MNKKELVALLGSYNDEDEVYLKLWKGRYAVKVTISSVGQESANFAYWYTNDFQDKKIVNKNDSCIFISGDIPDEG